MKFGKAFGQQGGPLYEGRTPSSPDISRDAVNTVTYGAVSADGVGAGDSCNGIVRNAHLDMA